MIEPLLRIAICDDKQEDLNRIKAELCQCLTGMELELRPEICLFSDGRAMYEESLQKGFSLAFLDLEMPGWNGFDLAERLHMSNPEIGIIFISIHDSMVYQSFAHAPIWFVRKKRLCREMAQAVQQYFRKTTYTRVRYRLKEGIGYRELRITDIRYIECSGHNVIIRTIRGGQYQKYGSLKAEEKELGKYGFIRIHKNFLVNMGHINEVGQRYVVLKDGTELDMGRDRKKAIVEGMARYGKIHS